MAEVRVKGGGERTALARRSTFDPFNAMQQAMQDMFDSFRPFSPWMERSFGGNLQPYGREGLWIPAFDVKERADSYVIEADLPGCKEDDLDITLTGNRLTVTGKRDESRREEGETYYSYERQSGSFSRAFTLPENVDANHISADLKDGVLSVVVPKTEAAKPRKISLKERIKQLKS